MHYLIFKWNYSVELAWCSSCVMEYHATTWNGIKIELHVLCKGQ